MATALKPIECSAQPLSISFHPVKDIVAAGLVDGTVEFHDLIAKCDNSSAAKAKAKSNDSDDDSDMEDDSDEADTILSSIEVAKALYSSAGSTQMLAKTDGSSSASSPAKKAAQGPSCRSVLFSRSPNDDANAQSGGEQLFTACNGGSIRCLDTELACTIDVNAKPDAPILWSIENAHNLGINKLYQLPYSSPCGPALVSGDDIGTVRLWDTRICGNNQSQSKYRMVANGNGGNNQIKSNNPFDNLMKLPTGCIQHYKVNHDYITDFETNTDGTTLFASSGDGTLSVFDIRYVNRKGTRRSVQVADINPHTTQQQQPTQGKKSTWETSGYTQSDNQEDELLSLCLLKKSQKLLCGTQQGILSLFSYNIWGDISDRFPGHPQSIDALLKIDEDTVLTGSSDGLVRAVQLLPNDLLGILGGHDGFPVEGLGWSAGRKLVGSVSHDEYIRLWDAKFLNEEDDDDEDDSDDEEDGKMQADEEVQSSKKQSMKGVTSTKGGEGSEDDWEDMDDEDDIDEDMDSDDDSDSDDSDDGGGGKPKKREKIFKTENESFFSDL